MLFHIGCTGRSGSVYVHKVITQMGIPVLHEKQSERPFADKPLIYVARNPKIFQFYRGTIGWQWDIDCKKLVSQAIYKFHLVRDPIFFLKSAITHDDSLYDKVEPHIGRSYVRDKLSDTENKLTRAANYWMGYLDTFGRNRKILKVEDFCQGGESLTTFSQIIGIPVEVTQLAVIKSSNINTRNLDTGYNENALNILQASAPDVFAVLMKRREELGYSDYNYLKSASTENVRNFVNRVKSPFSKMLHLK